MFQCCKLMEIHGIVLKAALKTVFCNAARINQQSLMYKYPGLVSLLYDWKINDFCNKPEHNKTYL